MTSKTAGRILIVDHSRAAVAYQETILRRRNNSVLSALAGTEALNIARTERPHLIIFGYDLFDMAGPEFCREIRDDEATRPISLLLVTDREHEQHADVCLSAGCNDVIYRPLQKRELDAKVQKLTSIPVRRQLRTLTKIEISMENQGRFVLARSLNISARGMLVETSHVITAEGAVRLHFYIPGDPRPMQVDAQVLRAEFTGTMARYGLQFVNATAEEQERIEQFVRRLHSRELL